MTSDIRAVTTRWETTCLHCGHTLPIGSMVHVVTDADGRPRAAHVSCDLVERRKAHRWEMRE